jgi:hypothetical protein
VGKNLGRAGLESGGSGKGESVFSCFCLFARNVPRQMASWLAFIGRQSVAMISGFRFERIFIIRIQGSFYATTGLSGV